MALVFGRHIQEGVATYYDKVKKDIQVILLGGEALTFWTAPAIDCMTVAC